MLYSHLSAKKRIDLIIITQCENYNIDDTIFRFIPIFDHAVIIVRHKLGVVS